MHQLPFDAKMTEKLFRIVEKQHQVLGRETDYAWSFVWGSRSLGRRVVNWVLTTIPRANAEPERLFIVAGLPLYISYEVEPWVNDQVFDWDDKEGVVSRER